MTRRIAGLAVAVLLAGTPLARADTLVTNGEAPWEMCGECHGLTGVSAVPRFPHLAGQDRAYIEKQLRDFRAGHRANDGGQMSGSVAELTEDGIARTAAYFSAQPPPAGAARAGDPQAWPRRARQLIEDGDRDAGIPACRSCHAPANTSAGAPFLTGQHAAYLVKQLEDFRAARRGNDAAGIMRAVAARLSDAEIAALAEALAFPLPAQ